MNKTQGLKAEMEQVRQEYRDEIASKIVEHPELSYETIAREFNVSLMFVARIVRERGLGRKLDKDKVVDNG